MVTDRHVRPDQFVDVEGSVTDSLTCSEAAADGIARTIMTGFDDYRRQFNQITAGARQRLEQADWRMMQKATRERIDLYDLSVSQTTSQICALATERGCASIEDEQPWQDAKRCYSRRNVECSAGELTETSFNSIYCRTFRHPAINDAKIFVRSRLPVGWEPPQTEICHYYALDGGLSRLIGQILDDNRFSIPYDNRRRDARGMVRHIKCHPLKGIQMNLGARLPHRHNRSE